MVAVLSSIVYCYAGCSTGSPDHDTINVLKCDTETGAAEIIQTVRGYEGPVYFQVDGRNRNLYVAFREAGKDDNPAFAASFPIGADGRLGDIRRLADLPCEAPCHLALSPDRSLAAVSAYVSATVATVPTAGGGARSVVLPDVGMGDFPRRQNKAHAHFAFFTAGGERVGFVDLGCDRVHFFDPVTMERDEKLSLLADRGDGPRHAVWSKDGRFLFLLNELSNTVISYSFENGVFTRVGKWSTLADGFKGETKAAAIKITDDGRILMTSNRGDDSIAFFAVDTASGKLTLKNIVHLKGVFPRDFELMPGEKFMVVGHKKSNEIQVYAFDRDACTLETVGKPIKAWMPLCFKFL